MSKFNLVRLMWYHNKIRWKYRTVSGTPPLTYNAKSDGVLKNYRIYGNTVNGESVGDRTGNLFTTKNELKNCYVPSSGTIANTPNYNTTDYLPVDPNTSYSYSFINSYNPARYCCIAFYNSNKEFISCDNHRDD